MSTKFPATLKEFGYAFNDAGQMRQIDPNDGSITDLPYNFEVSKDASYNQAHYEALGEVITEHVYQMLLDMGLHKIYVPTPQTKQSTFVFGTKTDFKNTKKLLFLIHGSGVVRAGQWARSLIINQSTDHGTQIPYIKRAIELGYDVLITNTNAKHSPEAHMKLVWEQLIDQAIESIESFAIVAHSYGGIVTVSLASKYPDAFRKKCSAIAFTDSVHSVCRIDDKIHDWFKENARNYVTSSKPLNTDLNSGPSDVPCFSAGHSKHEWTSWACIDAVFPYLEEKYEQFISAKLDNKDDSKHEDL